MPGLVIDWILLEAAFESHDPDHETYLDGQTGQLQVVAGLRSPPEHWHLVEPVPSREQYRMMERFIATVIHPALRDALQDAIVGKGAFRRFKDAVGRYPDERKRWFAFRDALLHRYILDWLKSHRVELMEMPAWNVDPPMTPDAHSEAADDDESPDSTPPTASTTTATSNDRAERAERSERAELDALKTYLQSWARAHGEEYRYLFGPQAFERLADDLSHEFLIHRKRSAP